MAGICGILGGIYVEYPNGSNKVIKDDPDEVRIRAIAKGSLFNDTISVDVLVNRNPLFMSQLCAVYEGKTYPLDSDGFFRVGNMQYLPELSPNQIDTLNLELSLLNEEHDTVIRY